MEHKLEYDSHYLKVFNRNGYLYSERLGQNSVAFILVDNNKKKRKYGLIKEFKPPVELNITTAFGGSIDKSLFYSSIVKEETLEEAGYDVSMDRIHHVGTTFVSTQSNQFCHLYLVDVTDIPEGKRTTTDPVELSAEVKWLSKKDIRRGDDWKAITILEKAKELK